LTYAVYRQSVGRYRVSIAALGFNRLPLKTYGRLALLFVPVSLAGVMITRLETAFIGGAPHSTQVEVLAGGITASPANFAMLTVLLVVVAPLAEETFFRGFLLPMLRHRMPTWAAVCGSAVAFAALHGSALLFPWLLFMGIVFGLVRVRTGSVYASILLHAMTNAVATLSIIAAVSGW
jgi:membrane protease YdiL (CAAX protease family)